MPEYNPVFILALGIHHFESLQKVQFFLGKRMIYTKYKRILFYYDGSIPTNPKQQSAKLKSL